MIMIQSSSPLMKPQYHHHRLKFFVENTASPRIHAHRS